VTQLGHDDAAIIKAALANLADKLELLAVSRHRSALIKLGRDMQQSGGCEQLVKLMCDPDPEVHRPALLLIGNLASDNIDPAAVVTRNKMRAADLLSSLLPHLDSTDYSTVVFALGVLMNFVSEGREPMLNASSPLRKAYLPKLEGLAKSEDEQLQLFAHEALHQLATGVHRREHFNATRIQCAYRVQRARRRLAIQRLHIASELVAKELMVEVTDSLANPLVHWGQGYAHAIKVAATSVQSAVRQLLARGYTLDARERRPPTTHRHPLAPPPHPHHTLTARSPHAPHALVLPPLQGSHRAP
jgi:hypothetical protein